MIDPPCIRVGVVGGTRLPGNVRTLLANIQRLLTDHPTSFELDLVVHNTIDAPPGYEQVDPGFRNPDRALGTLRVMTSVLTNYASAHEVDLLWQVTKFPLHGCATAVAGCRTDTPVLTRFAGDNFREFHFSSGLDKAKTFGLNNVLGQVPVHWSDRVIVLGPYGRSEVESRNDDVTVEEIPQPIDRDRFSRVANECERELARKFGFPASQRVFLTVGRLTERKGMAALVETAETLSDRGIPFKWYVLGDGPMREELATTQGVEPLGRVNFERMPDYYRAADLVVHPSLVEGLPNVLLEAAACGTPTLARDVGDSALVASATFDATVDLPTMLDTEYEAIALPGRFDDEQLRDRYAEALIKTMQ